MVNIGGGFKDWIFYLFSFESDAKRYQRHVEKDRVFH